MYEPYTDSGLFSFDESKLCISSSVSLLTSLILSFGEPLDVSNTEITTENN